MTHTLPSSLKTTYLRCTLGESGAIAPSPTIGSPCRQFSQHWRCEVDCVRRQPRTPEKITNLGTKACPGLRSGIDRSGSLSSVIRDIPWSIRPPIRHSGEGRNPEGRGEGNVARGLVPRWGRGGAWRNPPCQFAVPNHNSGFSYLGVPAPAGISDCYESMSRTPIRDRPLRQPLIRHSRHPLVNPAPNSSFRRRPESRGAGRGECSAGACPPLGSGWGVTESAVPIRYTKPHLRLFIPWCAGTSRHVQLVRKHVPDSDPGSIPAPAGGTNHRHPNNDSPGSQERCSAGACPPLGSGWGVAESAVPIRCPKPQLRLSYLRVPAPAACAIGTKACPGLRSGINSGTGRRHQPPSPEQRQPRVAREM